MAFGVSVAPRELVVKHQEAITADQAILDDALTTEAPTLFRVLVAVDTAGVFSASILRGDTEITVKFNGGSNLVADAAYMFDLLAHKDDAVNFKHSQTGNLVALRVQRIMAQT